jgi:subfamily B ATP-binding cassette protein MsbA
MAEARPTRHYGNLLRFYSYAVRYWKTVLLTLAAMMVYAAVSVNALVLIKPVVDAFQAEQAGAAGPQAAPQPEAGAIHVLDQTKERVAGWFRGLSWVQKLREWFWPGPDLTRVAALLAFVIGPIFLVSGFAQQYGQHRVAWMVVADVRMAVFNRLSALSLSYFSGQRTGEIVSRLTIDMMRTATALGVIYGKIILQPLMMLLFLGVALWSSPHLTIVGLLTLPLVAFLMGRYGRRIRRHATRTLEKLADVTDAVTQMLSGIRVVKSFNMEQAERDAFRERNREQVSRAMRLVRTEALAGVLPEFVVVVVATSVNLLIADRLRAAGVLTISDMLLCFGALTVVTGRVRRIIKAWNDLQNSIASVNRVFELIDSEPEIADKPGAVELDGVREGVRFDDVWFSYDAQPVLKGISLFVPCGRTYAVVGETGAGKSTMLDLIPRFYDIDRGSITVDGLDVRDLTHESLMRQIAIVGQHPFLFNRPIAENIRYGKPDATDEEVHQAARAANIHDFILTLPDGYETLAGEAGDRLSGGQRQCITIARAILKDAPILILDEATSSLDAESEMLVQRALERLMQGRTTFVIAHRLSTVRGADQIVVLRDGRIVEQGTHQELLRDEGEYHRLYRLQFASAPSQTSVEEAPAG